MKLLLHIDDSISAQDVADAGMEMFTNLPWCTKVEIVHDGCSGCAQHGKGSAEQESGEAPLQQLKPIIALCFELKGALSNSSLDIDMGYCREKINAVLAQLQAI